MITNPENYLSSGCTLLNLALTDNPYCAFVKGSYNFLVGDSMSGKTYFSMQLFAEASHDNSFDDYRLIHDDPEDGMLMDVAQSFGPATYERIESHKKNENGAAVASVTVEEMYLHAKKAFTKGPCIEIVDSMDALSSLSEMKKADKIEQAMEDDDEIKGTMSDGKAKANSSMLRQLMGPMQKTESMFFIICQTRDSVGKLFSEKTRSGGKALRFYATTELWFSVKGKIKKTVKGKEREVGTLVQIAVKKNRHSSQRPIVTVPLIHDYGFDDNGSCVDWLLEQKHWQGKQKIECPEFSAVPISREKLLAHIEEKEVRQEKLKKLVGKVWNTIREEMKPKRKKRYE